MDINPSSYSSIKFVYYHSDSELITKLSIFRQSIGFYFNQFDLQSSNKMLFSEKDFFVLVSWDVINETSCNVELKGWMVTNPFILNSTALTISLKGKFRSFPRKKALTKFENLTNFLDADTNNVQHIDESKGKKLIFGLFLRGVSLLVAVIILLVIYTYFQSINMTSIGLFLDIFIVALILFINKNINKGVSLDFDNF